MCDSATKSHLKKLVGRWFLTLSLIIYSGAWPVVIAGPQAAQISHGEVVINQTDALTTHVTQHSHQAIIDWQQFNLNANEQIHFFQSRAQASLLNRIHDSDSLRSAENRRLPRTTRHRASKSDPWSHAKSR